MKSRIRIAAHSPYELFDLAPKGAFDTFLKLCRVCVYGDECDIMEALSSSILDHSIRWREDQVVLQANHTPVCQKRLPRTKED